MNKLLSAVGGVATVILLFPSCSPKVTTQVLKSYPPLPDDAPIALYEYGEQVPESAEVIAFVSVKDGGTSTKCNYPTVIGLAENEARQVGGNGLQITNHLTPSIWGSSCHQIAGNILRLGVADTLINDNPADNFTVADYNRIHESSKRIVTSVAPYEFSINIGYAIFTNRVKVVDSSMEKLEKKLRKGLTWDVKFNRYYQQNLGWGLIYSGYNASAADHGKRLENDVLLTYIAPAFVGKSAFNKWELKYEVGLGYLGYRNQVTEGSTRGRVTGATVGFHSVFGVNYKISESFALGAEIAYIGGSYEEVHSDNIDTSHIDSDNRMGALRLNFNIGLRYLFGSKK